MSSDFKSEQISRTEVKVFIVRRYTNQKKFCESTNLNYGTFKKWMRGDNSMPNFTAKIIEIIKSENYPIKNIITPGTRLEIEGVAS